MTQTLKSCAKYLLKIASALPSRMRTMFCRFCCFEFKLVDHKKQKIMENTQKVLHSIRIKLIAIRNMFLLAPLLPWLALVEHKTQLRLLETEKSYVFGSRGACTPNSNRFVQPTHRCEREGERQRESESEKRRSRQRKTNRSLLFNYMQQTNNRIYSVVANTAQANLLKLIWLTRIQNRDAHTALNCLFSFFFYCSVLFREQKPCCLIFTVSELRSVSVCVCV